MRDFAKCFVYAKYPALVPKFELSAVEETVVMDTGVDPAAVGAGGVGRKRKRNEIKFASRSNVYSIERVTGTQWGDSFCGSE